MIPAGQMPRLRTVETSVDVEQQRRAINRVSFIALWVWPAFHVLDIFMILALYPNAHYLRYPALRLANTAVIAWTMWLGKRNRSDPTTLLLAHAFSYGLMGLTISIMALEFGGWHSVYMHGISIVIFGRSLLMPSPWRRGLVESGLTIATFPLVMTIASAVSAGGLPPLPDRASVALFASNYVFLVGSMVTSALAGHIAWAAQRQIYRARKIGRYRLEAPIAKGGMGEMWLAWDEALRRNVALKLLRTDGPADASRTARFEREAHAASQLNDTWHAPTWARWATVTDRCQPPGRFISSGRPVSRSRRRTPPASSTATSNRKTSTSRAWATNTTSSSCSTSASRACPKAKPTAP
jgi:eukaryotic-like serine/threonine-protein kinase